MRKSTLIIVALYAAILMIASTGCAPSKTVKVDMIWPSPPETPRIRYLYSIHSKEDLQKGKFQNLEKALGGSASASGLQKPNGVAVDKIGRIIVADAGNRCVQIFNPTPVGNERFLMELGKSGEGKLNEPIGVAVDSSGCIYVSDVNQAIVNCYNPDLTFSRTIGSKGTFKRPTGIAVNPVNGDVVILDSKAHKVFIFDKIGNLSKTFGEFGNEKGKFNIPLYVVCDKNGKIYIVDSMNFRVQIFSPAGEFLSCFGQANNVPGSFARPRGIALDSEGHIYVGDANFNNIQLFEKDGSLLLFFGELGARDGQFQLPAGMCFDGNDRLYIADQYNQKIQVYQYIRNASK